MSDGLTCPECGEPLRADEEWLITDRSLIGKTVGGGESLQGDYAHADCLDGPARQAKPETTDE